MICFFWNVHTSPCTHYFLTAPSNWVHGSCPKSKKFETLKNTKLSGASKKPKVFSQKEIRTDWNTSYQSRCEKALYHFKKVTYKTYFISNEKNFLAQKNHYWIVLWKQCTFASFLPKIFFKAACSIDSILCPSISRYSILSTSMYVDICLPLGCNSILWFSIADNWIW